MKMIEIFEGHLAISHVLWRTAEGTKKKVLSSWWRWSVGLILFNDDSVDDIFRRYSVSITTGLYPMCRAPTRTGNKSSLLYRS